MGDYVVFQMGSGYRESLIRAHQFYVNQAKSRLLTQFSNISAEADKAEEDWMTERAKRFFDPDRDDPSELYEGAEDAGIEFYQLLTEMQERTRLSVIAGFFHEWEKKLRQCLADEINHWHRGKLTKERIWKANFEEIYDLLESFGWALKSTSWFSALDACRLVVNVHKHGDGPSLASLKAAYPKFLVHPLAGTGLRLTPRWDRLTHEHLQVNDADLEEFADAVASFWREIPENVVDSQVVALPSWFVKVLEKDRAGKVKP
jgi:hypothetical protein